MNDKRHVYHGYVWNPPGSNGMVMDSKRNIVQKTQYYPYGEPWREPTEQPWLYSGNERLRLDGINEYDFNARRFNSVEGRFSSWDAMNEKYPWLSPYAYCGGDPVNAVDKDGKLIIFINGMHAGSGGTKDYWNGIDTTCKGLFSDYNCRYYDGSIGGLLKIRSNYSSSYRYGKGKEKALKDAEVIYSSIKQGETIKIVTHSMGGMFGKGFVEGLLEYAKKNNLSANIEFEIDFASYQSIDQTANPIIPTYSLAHGDDIVAGPSLMKGGVNINKRPFGLMVNMIGMVGIVEGVFAHSISSFKQDLINLGLKPDEGTGGDPNIWEEKRSSR